MKTAPRTLFAGLYLVLYMGSLNALCQPSPQASSQGAAPPGRPGGAQVVLAPAPWGTAQLPPQASPPADARKPDLLLRVGHSGSVQALAFSPDGKWLASGGYDRSIIVWNLASGREQFRLEPHGGAAQQQTSRNQQPSINLQVISGLAFSPDQTRLVSVEVSGAVRVWNLQSRTLLFAIHPHRVHYYGGAVAYTADGKSLLVPVEKRAKDATETSIGLCDAETGKLLRTIPTKWNVLWALVPTADGRLIASGTTGADDDDDPSGSVEIFDLTSGEVRKSYPVIASVISPDGRWMSSFDNAGIYHPVLWNVGDGKRIYDLTPKNANRLVFRPDGQEVAVTHGDSNAIDFVSTSTGQITKSLGGGGYGLGTAAYSPDGKLLAAGSYSFGTIKVWDLATMKERTTLYGQSPVQSVTFSPDGKWLAASSGELRIWDVAAGAEVVTLTDAPVNRAVFSDDGKWLAANPGGQFPQYAVKIWNTNTWREVESIPKENGFTGFWLAFSDAKSAPQKIGNVQSLPFVGRGEPHVLWGSGVPMAVSPDGRWLAQPWGGTGTAEIWDAATGQKLRSILAAKLVIAKLAWSRDGRWLVCVGQDSNPGMVEGRPGVLVAYARVSVWDTRTWKLQFSVTFSSTAGTDADISADGKLVAISRGGGATELFDLEQNKAVAAFDSPDGRGGPVTFSPDGTVFVQGAQEGIRLWKLLPTQANAY